MTTVNPVQETPPPGFPNQPAPPAPGMMPDPNMPAAPQTVPQNVAMPPEQQQMAPPPPQQSVSQRYTVLNMTPQQMNRQQRAVQTNWQGRTLSPQDFQHITLPPRGIDVWPISDGNDTQYHQEFEGIIIHTGFSRAWYIREYTPGVKEPPSCASVDGVTGYGNNGEYDGVHECFTCPKNVFGTSRTGKGTACPKHRSIYILMPDRILPTVVQVPATSFRYMDDYFRRLTHEGKPYDTVVTKFRLRKYDEENVRIVFDQGEVLNDAEDQKVQAFAGGIVALIQAHSSQQSQLQVQPGASPAPRALGEPQPANGAVPAAPASAAPGQPMPVQQPAQPQTVVTAPPQQQPVNPGYTDAAMSGMDFNPNPGEMGMGLDPSMDT